MLVDLLRMVLLRAHCVCFREKIGEKDWHYRLCKPIVGYVKSLPHHPLSPQKKKKKIGESMPLVYDLADCVVHQMVE